MSEWTEAMDAVLREAKRNGRSFSMIPPLLLAIGVDKSRSACIGRAKRLGLTLPVDRKAQALGTGSVAKRIASRRALPPHTTTLPMFEEMKFAKPWIDRGPGECAWPIERGERPADWWSCCAPTVDGNYCDPHNKRMWRKHEAAPAPVAVSTSANQRRTAA